MGKYIKLGILEMLFFFAAFLPLGAQERTLEIYGGQGAEFVVVSQGKRTIYGEDKLKEGTISLYPGDIFQTGPGSFAELRLSDGVSLLKVAENSSLRLPDSAESRGMTGIDLFYGRIRLKLAGPTLPLITAGNYGVELESGDVAVDYVLPAEKDGGPAATSSPVLFVSLFEGQAGIVSAREPSPAVLWRMNGPEGFVLDSGSSHPYIERRYLDKDILAYWNEHNFSGEPSLAVRQDPASQGTAAQEAAETAETGLPPEDGSHLPREAALRKGTSIGIGVSLAFTVASMVLAGGGLYYLDKGNQDMARNFLLPAFALSGTSVLSLICVGAANRIGAPNRAR